MSKRFLFTIVPVFMATLILGQGGFYNRNAWKRLRKEISFGGGAANFLGDLGGRDLVGSDFIWDTELSKTRYVAHATFMYYLTRNVGMRTSFHYAKVGGDDALTQEIFRHNRNLNFESNIFEGSVTFEIQFKKETIGNIYNLKSPTGKKLGLKSLPFGVYGMFGVGGFTYNPMGTDASGNKVELKPLHTEGQGLTTNHYYWGELSGPKQYKGYSICVPVGFGIRKSINRYWGWKVEVSHRFTFTDYIDDVSGVYFDNAEIANAYGAQAAYFADPNLGVWGPIQPGQELVQQTATNQQRGDATDKDGYMFFKFSLYKRILSTPKRKRKKSVRRVKASF